MIRILLSTGANVDDRSREEDKTPLMYAAERNENPGVITALLGAGAKMNDRQKDGLTPLMLAVCGNTNSEIITVLMKAGADPKAVSNEGKTAFEYAQAEVLFEGTDAYLEPKKATY